MEVERAKLFLKALVSGYIEIDLQSSKKRAASDNHDCEREAALGNLKAMGVGEQLESLMLPPVNVGSLPYC